MAAPSSSTTPSFSFDVDASSHADVFGPCKSTSPHSIAAPLPAANFAGVESLESLAPAGPFGDRNRGNSRGIRRRAPLTQKLGIQNAAATLPSMHTPQESVADADRNVARGCSRRAQLSAGKEAVVRGRAEAPCSSSLGILASGPRGGHVVTRTTTRVGERPFPAICMRILHGRLESPHRWLGAANSLRYGVSATK